MLSFFHVNLNLNRPVRLLFNGFIFRANRLPQIIQKKAFPIYGSVCDLFIPEDAITSHIDENRQTRFFEGR